MILIQAIRNAMVNDLVMTAYPAPRGCQHQGLSGTETQRGNGGMRALNTGLGYTTRSETITMHASLPLPRSPAGSAGSSPPPGR